MPQISQTSLANYADATELLTAFLTDVTAIKTAADTQKTAIDELIDDHATFKTVVDALKTLVNDLRAKLLGDYVDGATVLAIGSEATGVAYGAFDYHINGKEYSLSVDSAGVALSGAVVPDAKAGAWALEVDAAGTVSIVEAPANATGYASEAAAVAALPAQTDDKARLGTVSVLMSGGTFTPGTTELSAVTVSHATFTDATPLLTTIGSAVSSSSPATLTASKPTATGSLTVTA
jgi:hypothetical protein